MSGSREDEGLSSTSKEAERDRISMFDMKYGQMREKIVLQRLIVLGRLPRSGAADRTDVGARFEQLTFELSRRHAWDTVTGLLLLHPSCLLHVVESTRDVLVSVLKDLQVMQQQPDCAVQEAKILFLAHSPANRLFQQWSYKVLAADVGVKGQEEEEEESTEALVGSVLSALQKLAAHLQISKEALDGAPELTVPRGTLEKLLGRRELLSPAEYLQMYDAPRHISLEFGQVNLRNFFPTV